MVEKVSPIAGRRPSKSSGAKLGVVSTPDRICLTCTHYLSEGAQGFCREGPGQVVVAEMREDMRSVETIGPGGKPGHKLVKHFTVTNYSTRFPSMLPVGSCGRHKPRDHK